MEFSAKKRDGNEVKPSLLSLVNKDEMRRSLGIITDMPTPERKKYAARIMGAYSESLLEVGFDEKTHGYHVAELILCAMNMAIFGRGWNG